MKQGNGPDAPAQNKVGPFLPWLKPRGILGRHGELNGTEIQSVEISKPVKWLGYESIRTEHATNLVVQQYNGEFILYFFEVQPPFTTGTPQEQATQFQEVPHVEARCVAKIIMSPPNAANATNFLIEQLNNFEVMLQNAKRDQENAK